MARPRILVCVNFLYALYRRDDPEHLKVRTVVQTFRGEYVLPQVVLSEAAFLFNRAGGRLLVANFLGLLAQSGMLLEPVTYADLDRARELLRAYPRTKIELVDCCIIALAERLNIPRVATLDRRDFSIMRTKDGKFLEILP